MDDIRQDINRVEQRVRRYWVDDGLAEILSGLILGLAGVYMVIVPHIPDGPWSAVLAVVLPLLLMGLILGSRRLIVAAKDRFVHPRTGYVRFPTRRMTHRWLSGILAGCIAALFAFLINGTPFIRTWIPALEGLLLATAFFLAGSRMNLLRFPVQGVLCAVAGLLLSMRRMDENFAAGLLMAGVGLTMAVGGALAFRSYLRHSPPPEEA